MEWLIYLCYPLLAFIIYRCHQQKTNLILFVLLCTALFFAVHERELPEAYRQVVFYGWKGGEVPRAMLDFMLGMVMYNLYRTPFLKNLNHDLLCGLLLITIFTFPIPIIINLLFISVVFLFY